jgi:hypothetical protein
MQVIDELDRPILDLPRYGDEIRHGEVLNQLTKPDTPGVRKDAHAELARQK